MVAFFNPALVGIKLAVKLVEPPAAIVAGKLIPLTVNEDALVPPTVIPFKVRLPIPVFCMLKL